MKIQVINPNSTVSMTEKILESISQIVSQNVEIISCTAQGTPASIEGHYDEAMAVPALLEEVARAEQNNIDGVVVACFDDPGIGACREIFSGPVIGICEAGMKAATMLATSFSVVTTLPRSIPIIEELTRRYGCDHFCRKVRAADIPVLDLEEDNGARDKVKSEIQKAINEDNCESVLLGCAGMADLTPWLSKETGIPVIDGVTVAVKFVEALIGSGLKTSKVSGYAFPNIK